MIFDSLLIDIRCITQVTLIRSLQILATLFSVLPVGLIAAYNSSTQTENLRFCIMNSRTMFLQAEKNQISRKVYIQTLYSILPPKCTWKFDFRCKYGKQSWKGKQKRFKTPHLRGTIAIYWIHSTLWSNFSNFSFLFDFLRTKKLNQITFHFKHNHRGKFQLRQIRLRWLL